MIIGDFYFVWFIQPHKTDAPLLVNSILRLEGPRIEDALSKPKVQKALQDKANETLQKRLDAGANYILSKAGS